MENREWKITSAPDWKIGNCTYAGAENIRPRMKGKIMAVTEKRANELMDAMHNGEFDEHREWDCAVTAINHKETFEKLEREVKFFQKGHMRGKYSNEHEINFLLRLGRTAAEHYVKVSPSEFPSWRKVMDMPTRCACGRRIAKLLWEH